MSRMLVKVNAEQAAFCILLYGLLAPVAASVALIVLSLPDFAFSFIADHCHDLDCAPHRLQVTLTTVQAVTIVSILLSLLIGVCAMIALQLFSSRNKLKTLNGLAESTSSAYKVLDSKAALAWCSGLFNPKIFISRRLTETLTKEQMQIVLAHEYAHVRRKDNLRKWVIHWVTIAWTKRYRIRIRQDLSDYTEQVCDLEAMRSQQETFGITAVMETLKKCYTLADKNENNERADDYIVRAQMLKRAWESRSASSKTFTHWVPTVFMSSLWLIAVILTVHVGHPILEWMAA